MSLMTRLKRLGEDNARYRARLYYLRKEENLMEIHFVIIKNLEVYVAVC